MTWLTSAAESALHKAATVTRQSGTSSQGALLAALKQLFNVLRGSSLCSKQSPMCLKLAQTQRPSWLMPGHSTFCRSLLCTCLLYFFQEVPMPLMLMHAGCASARKDRTSQVALQAATCICSSQACTVSYFFGRTSQTGRHWHAQVDLACLVSSDCCQDAPQTVHGLQLSPNQAIAACSVKTLQQLLSLQRCCSCTS